jgi:hypothetical protein
MHLLAQNITQSFTSLRNCLGRNCLRVGGGSISQRRHLLQDLKVLRTCP